VKREVTLYYYVRSLGARLSSGRTRTPSGGISVELVRPLLQKRPRPRKAHTHSLFQYAIGAFPQMIDGDTDWPPMDTVARQGLVST